MSESAKIIERFTVDGYGRQDICRDEDGEFVYYEDYLELKELAEKRTGELVEALEAAEKRVAELEARTLTVKWPLKFNIPKCFSPTEAAEAKGVNRGIDEARECLELACASQGIKLQIEGE